jgi:hypothetical protein
MIAKVGYRAQAAEMPPIVCQRRISSHAKRLALQDRGNQWSKSFLQTEPTIPYKTLRDSHGHVARMNHP